MLYNSILTKKYFSYLVFPIVIFIYSILINKFSGNNGVVPVDSFSHFDTSALVLKNIYPVRDYWMNTGFLINFIQAFFFNLFGLNWQSYILHASLFNALVALVTYFFFTNLQIKRHYSFFYAICFATLFYPTAGTPSVYFHSSMFSLISIYSFILCYLNKSNLLAFLAPIFVIIGFLCAQVPSAYIGVLIIFGFLIIAFKEKKLFFFFILGSIMSLILLIFFLKITKIELVDFIQQHILFPLSIGVSRVLNNNDAYGKLSDITIDRVIFDFKFIYVFWLPLFIITFRNILFEKKINIEKNFINFFFLISVICFIFYQLTTNNQLFIYFLIPVTAGILHYNLANFNSYTKIKFIFIMLIVFTTLKYGHRNIIEKRFNDFQWTDMSVSIDANMISSKLHGLKWVTPLNWGLSRNVKKEIQIINDLKLLMKKDDRNKVLMTNFQLFSIISDNKIFYTQTAFFQNATNPDENSKFYKYYSQKINHFLKKNNIRVVYFFDVESLFFSKIIEEKCRSGKINIKEYEIKYIEIIKCG